MTKQNQQNEQRQSSSTRGKNPDQQGGRNAQGQPGNTQPSQGQPGARQSDQSGGESESRNNAPKGSQRGQTNQQGSRSNDDDEKSPEMNQAGEQSNQSGGTRQAELDAQYGTDSSSKTGQQTNRPQSSQSQTGSDRDTMGGSRSKAR